MRLLASLSLGKRKRDASSGAFATSSCTVGKRRRMKEAAEIQRSWAIPMS